MATTVVAGFDGSEGSTRALDRAISDVKAASGKLVIVVVAPMPFDPLAPPTVGPWVPGPADPSEEALAQDFAENQPPPALEPFVEQATKRATSAGLDPEVIWRMGDPVHEILDAARDSNASAIVLGEHHHRLLGGLFGEDVDGGVERHAKCKVVVVA